MLILDSKRWSQKPPVGAQINWGHPLVRSDDLVGCWLLNEAAGLRVRNLASGGFGTFEGGVSWVKTSTGPIVDFDGSSTPTETRINLGDVLNIARLPVSVVARCTVANLGDTRGVFATDKTSGTHSGMWCTVRATGAIALEFGDNTGGATADRRSKVTATSLVATDTPVHLAGVIRGATDMTIYRNAVDQGGTYSGTGGAMAHSTRVATIGGLGQTADGSSDLFDGTIEYVYLYTTALRPDAVRWLLAEPYAFFLPQSPRLRYFFPSVAAAPAVDVYSGRGIGRGMGRGIYR